MKDFFSIAHEELGVHIPPMPPRMRRQLSLIAHELLEQNSPEEPKPPQNNDPVLMARYRDALEAYNAFDDSALVREIVHIVALFVAQYPFHALPDDGEMVEAGTLIPSPQNFVTTVALTYRNHKLFPRTGLLLTWNLDKLKVFPNAYKGDPLDYLQNTPFKAFFEVRVAKPAFTIPEPVRVEHTHVLGGSGHGKSTLLCQQLIADLDKPDPPGLIIIDGKGTFVEEVQRFQRFAPGSSLSERVVIIDPRDMHYPPAMNMFVMPERTRVLPDHVRQQIENETIANFAYVFSAKDFKLTEKQATCLSYAVRLLTSMKPTPNIMTLLELMGDPVIPKVGGIPETSKFKPFVEQQPVVVRQFITSLFYHATEYGETKRQIQNRIYSLLENPFFAAMFSASERKLDMFDVLQQGKILLVNSSPAALGEKAAPLLGRYIISLALTSAYARLATPKREWRPVYLILDEAQMFVDEDKTQPLLQQAREFNLGVVLAHQKLDDLTPTLRATLASNTSLRYVGGVSATDAAFMARNMECEPEFITAQRKTATRTSFACYVRGRGTASVSVPLGLLDREPKMTPDDFRVLQERNRLQLAPTPTPAASPAPPPPERPAEPEAKALEPPRPVIPDEGAESGDHW